MGLFFFFSFLAKWDSYTNLEILLEPFYQVEQNIDLNKSLNIDLNKSLLTELWKMSVSSSYKAAGFLCLQSCWSRQAEFGWKSCKLNSTKSTVLLNMSVISLVKFSICSLVLVSFKSSGIICFNFLQHFHCFYREQVHGHSYNTFHKAICSWVLRFHNDVCCCGLFI